MDNLQPKKEDVKMHFNKIARENFSKWNESLQTGDPKIPASFYTNDATFLPTLSRDFKKGKEGALEYFTHFLKKSPKGEIREDEVQPLSEKFYLHSGLYDFEVDGENGRETVEARFTYAWEQGEGGEWKIAHHHSSLKPVS